MLSGLDFEPLPVSKENRKGKELFGFRLTILPKKIRRNGPLPRRHPRLKLAISDSNIHDRS
jgi:hypothetical protein